MCSVKCFRIRVQGFVFSIQRFFCRVRLKLKVIHIPLGANPVLAGAGMHRVGPVESVRSEATAPIPRFEATAPISRRCTRSPWDPETCFLLNRGK